MCYAGRSEVTALRDLLGSVALEELIPSRLAMVPSYQAERHTSQYALGSQTSASL